MLSRRTFLAATGTVLTLGQRSFADGKAPMRVYFGTYTGSAGSKGIYRATFDPATGMLGTPELAGETGNPSFVIVHPTKKFLYAVGEGGKGNGVTSFTIDSATGNLTKLNARSSGGAGPCHLACDQAGKTLVVANYGSGTTASYVIGEDGQLSEPVSVFQHEGKGANPKRQEKPHAHSATITPNGKLAIVADLGTDRLQLYAIGEGAKLTPADPASITLAPGAGPRHCAFHPTLPFAFVINELDSTITILAYDAEKGTLTPKGSVSTLPKGFAANNGTAEIVVHPEGKFVYGSNRGHNSIAAFTFDGEKATLTPIGHAVKDIDTPRNFNLDPTGKWMLVANQATNTVLTFAIDPATGMPKPTDRKVEIGSPVCIKFVVL